MFNLIKNIGPTELIIIVLILIVLFGSKAIAGLGRTGGETFKEIKKIKKGFTEAIKDDDNEPSKS